MTDKTNSGTVSVSRELLERVSTQELGMTAKKDRAAAAHELRAMLAQPADQQDEPVYFFRSHGAHSWEQISGESLDLCRCQSDEYEIAELYRRPAAQSEPVGYQIRTKTDRPDSRWSAWPECCEMTRAMHSHEAGKFNRFGVMREIRPVFAAPAALAVKLPDVEGDVLPEVGSTVLIHLASSDTWVPRSVVGHYAWGDLGGNDSLHRIFVRVRDAEGHLNARLLKDVRKVDAVATLNGIEP